VAQSSVLQFLSSHTALRAITIARVPGTPTLAMCGGQEGPTASCELTVAFIAAQSIVKCCYPCTLHAHQSCRLRQYRT
jgi:hypothetical protein